MSGVRKALRGLGEDLRPGQSLASALTATRLNSILDSIRLIARGDHIAVGPGLVKRGGSGGLVINQLRSRGKGGVSTSVRGSLVLTRTPPPGWVAPGGSSGKPIFVTFGTACGVVPAGIDDEVTRMTAAGVRYVWIEADLSDTAVDFVTGARFRVSTNPSAYPNDVFGEEGEPPAKAWVMLGQVTAIQPAGSPAPPLQVTVSNTGSGSVVFASHVSDLTFDSSGVPTNVRRALSFWRTGNA